MWACFLLLPTALSIIICLNQALYKSGQSLISIKKDGAEKTTPSFAQLIAFIKQ